MMFGKTLIKRCPCGVFLVVFMIGFLLSTAGCVGENEKIAYEYGEARIGAMDVSMMDLIAMPERYDGRLVRVKGIGHLEFEICELHLSMETYLHSIGANSLWIHLYKDEAKMLGTTFEELQRHNGKPVIIEGVFNAENNGHMGFYWGAIEQINRYAVLEGSIENVDREFPGILETYEEEGLSISGKHVSLVHLIKVPERYDGKNVSVTAVAKLVAEGNSLYLSMDDCKEGNTENAIWLEFNWDRVERWGTTYEELQKSNGQYVMIFGKFNSENRGKDGAFRGAIEDVSAFSTMG